MPHICRYKRVRRLATAGIAGAAMLIGSPGTALAAYGPPTPTPPVAIPGGYYCIVTSQTVGPAGKATGPLRFQRLVVRLGVSKGTFPVQVQITVTEPYGQNGN